MKRLYRSRSDIMIAGVCSGLADYIGIDPTIVRLIFLLLLFAALGGFWLYILLWIIMPIQPGNSIESVEVKAKPKARTKIKTEEPLELEIAEKPSAENKKTEK